MNVIKPELIDEIFQALDRQISLRCSSPLSLVVCGGTALAALNLISRTTKDVDVLGLAVEMTDGIIVQSLNQFPDWFIEAKNVVARDFNLPENWINLGPASQVESGLPEGFSERLIKKKYGELLSIYFISRIDQIHFKLYAAIDRNDYHVQDLFALNPTEDEIEKAAIWAMSQDPSEGFLLILKDFLVRFNYGIIAARI